MIFTSDEVASENHWEIASRVTQKSLFTATNILFYFLHAILYPERMMSLKQWPIAYLFIVAKDGVFWLSIAKSPQLICDVRRTIGTSIMRSYSSIVLARANWRKGDLRKWTTTANIDFSPPVFTAWRVTKHNYNTLFTQYQPFIYITNVFSIAVEIR